MKRITALATSVVVAGSVLLPTAASASPWVTATSSGVPVEGGTGQPGLPIDIEGTGCDNTGGTAVMGNFVAMSDPWTLEPGGPAGQNEFAVDAEGGFTWDVVISADDPIGTVVNRWYCATAPVTSLQDAAVTWVSPTATITIETTGTGEGAAPTKRTAGKRTVATKAASGTTVVKLTMDPDALPAIDKVDILGPQAARLKAKVDDRAKLNNGVDRVFAWLLGRGTPRVTSADYVDAAFDVVGGKKPSAKVLKGYADRLDAGELKVQVVEDIALSQKPASHWNKKG